LSPQRSIIIVGAGFSGTVVAANLLKSQHRLATRVVLIERAQKVARGKAYADRGHPYLLNVPAGRMSVNPKAPLEFLVFARHRIPNATADDFLPRNLYGEYLETTLLDAELSAAPHVRLDRVRGDVSALEKIPGSASVRVQLADGRSLTADDVVLALGNPAPATIRGAETLTPSSHGRIPDAHYVSDPWTETPTFHRGESLLLIGSGLTMADMATAAAETTDGQTVIHSISRHGLVPPSQTAFPHAACKGDSAALIRAASISARTLFRSIRDFAEETERQGGDWREAVTFVRGILPALWKRLAVHERRRLLRHGQSYWDVHRHRLPNETTAKLDELRAQRKLNIHAGRLVSFERIGRHIRVTWRPRGRDETQTLLVDRVINCTGPDYSARRSREPLMRSLLSQGLAATDALDLGLRIDANGALIDSKGRPATNLFYVGPLLRADHWEATAAHELRGHAERLASHLISSAATSSESIAHPSRHSEFRIATSA
jgi:uncharacterized NAD(P)/FAD-binding protein YdhS